MRDPRIAAIVVLALVAMAAIVAAALWPDVSAYRRRRLEVMRRRQYTRARIDREALEVLCRTASRRRAEGSSGAAIVRVSPEDYRAARAAYERGEQ